MDTKIGVSVRTLPTVKPKLYAGKTGTIAVKNEDEIGVLINGRIVWFLEREIEIWSSPTVGTAEPPSRKLANNGHTSSTGLPARNQSREGSKSDLLPQALPTAAASCRQTLPIAREEARMPHGCPVTNPGVGAEGQEAAMGLEGDSGPSRICEGATVGERGPSGGIIARCEGCGGLWERPKQRGRPARRCEECRG